MHYFDPSRSIHRRDFFKTTIAAGSAMALAGSALRPSNAQDTVSLALDWYPNANHAGIFLALQRGYFDDAGVPLDPYTPSDPTTVLQTVGAGRDDFGISYQTDVLLARDQDVPVVSVAALVQVPLLTVMALQDPGLTSPADLVGKSIGYPGIPSQVAILETMLEQVDESVEHVELVNIGFNLVSALISKQVDAVLGAYWTHETILAAQEGYPVDFLRVEDWGVPRYYELVVVASEDTVATKPELVTSMLGALQRGYVEAIQEPANALAALEAAYPEIDVDVERQGIELLTPAWVSDAPFFGYQSMEQWQTYAAWMVSKDLLSDDVTVDSAFTGELIPVPESSPVARS